LAAIAVPKFYENAKQEREHGREAAALNSLRTIHNSEMEFKRTNLRFARLEELADSSLLDQMYVGENAVSGYIYSSSEVSEKTVGFPAVRAGCPVGRHDSVICEDGIFRLVK